MAQFIYTLVAATSLALAALAAAQTPPMDHSKMDHSKMGTPSGATSPSAKAFAAANAKMHGDMARPLTGDADVDFIKGMIPHHQGAVDMAEIVLQYGKDPEVRKLAEAIIKGQSDEIAGMKAWVAKSAK